MLIIDSLAGKTKTCWQLVLVNLDQLIEEGIRFEGQSMKAL